MQTKIWAKWKMGRCQLYQINRSQHTRQYFSTIDDVSAEISTFARTDPQHSYACKEMLESFYDMLELCESAHVMDHLVC